MSLLQYVHDKHTFYFKDRDSDLEMLGWGEPIQTLEQPSQPFFFLQEFEETKLRYLIYPKLLVKSKGTIEALEISSDGTYKPCLFQFSSAPKKAAILPTLQLTLKTPDKETWEQNIEITKALFKSEKLSKICLSRRTDYLNAEISHIEKILNTHASSFRILIKNPSEIFFSVTPERLFKITDSTLVTEALAGTTSNHEDHALENSSKDQMEHQIVVEGICQALKKLNGKVEVHNQELLKLSEVSHLFTRIQATGDFSDLNSLTQELHPTPAVSGFPQKISQKYIAEIETYHRGLYAGVVGLKHDNVTHAAVTIRSGILVDNRLTLTTGVGIVEDSIADKEWHELDLKLKSILSGIDIDGI